MEEKVKGLKLKLKKTVKEELVHSLQHIEPLYDKLKEAGFVFTDTLDHGASYIMPDGKFLNIGRNANLLGLSNSAFACHPQLDIFVLENGLVPEDSLINRVLCETDNAVRINDGTNLAKEVIVGLPQYNLTNAQYNSLEDFLWNIMSRGIKHITVGDERTINVFKEYYFNETMPDEIINKIRTYYVNGILREDLVKIVNK